MNIRDSWATPQMFFDEQRARFKFTIDACAEPWNAKLARYWGPPVADGLVPGWPGGYPGCVGINGLAQSWAGERVWCNPPYGRGLIQPWVDKALAFEAELVVLLLPVRTSTAWFQRLRGMERKLYRDGAVDIEFLPKRIRFEPPSGVKASSPMEDSLLAIVRRT